MKRISIAIALMMVALLMGCNLELVDTSIFDVVEEENQAGLESGFAGGNGTEASPFLVDNTEQFMNMVESEPSSEMRYYKFTNDIVVPSATYVASFEGVVDGDGHSLIIDGICLSNDWNQYWLFDSFAGEIRNLDYHTTGYKALIGQPKDNDSLVIRNVDVYGNMEGADSNVGAFLIYQGYGSTLLMEDCNNYADIIDSEGGRHYGAPFIGGYPLAAKINGVSQCNGGSVTLRNCNNYGDLFFGEWAGFVFGNANNIELFKNSGGTITVENCYNYGAISAVEAVGFESNKDTTDTSAYVKGNGSFSILDPNYVESFSVAADGTPTVSVDSEAGNDVVVSYSMVAFFNYPKGTRTITYPIDIVKTEGKLPVSQVHIKEANGHENGEVFSNGDGTWSLCVDPDSYEMGTGGTISPDWKYVALIKENGVITGSATCSIDKE